MTGSCSTWAAKGESWMLESFSWRCGPSRSRELEAEARPIQRGNKVQIFFTVKRINYWNNLLEAVQGSLSHVVFKSRPGVSLKYSFPQQKDGLTPPQGMMFSSQTPDCLTVIFPIGLKNLWILWTEKTVYSITGNGSRIHQKHLGNLADLWRKGTGIAFHSLWEKKASLHVKAQRLTSGWAGLLPMGDLALFTG